MNNHDRGGILLANKLTQYFPILRTREEIQEEIQANDALRAKFSEWTLEQQSDTGLQIDLLLKYLLKNCADCKGTFCMI